MLSNGRPQRPSSPPPTGRPTSQTGSKVLLFSPHPDDECITGLLPLRLSQELGKEIINIPVTFGSNLARQAGRAQELAQACRYLGWNLHRGRDGLQALEVGEVMAALTAHQPEAIFFPHEKDWNTRHLEINQLLKSALAGMPKDFSCLLSRPNTGAR